MIVEMEKYKERGKKLKEVRNINDLNTSGQYGLVVKSALRFFSEYGFDIAVCYYYAHGLRKLGFVEEAITVLKELVKIQEQYNIRSYFEDAKLELFKAYFMNDHYQEAYELYEQVKSLLDSSKYYSAPAILGFLKSKLNMQIDEPLNDILFSQILEYSRDYALEHIQKHIVEVPEDDDVSMFADVDIENIFNLAQMVIKDSKKLPVFSLRDAYIFSFPHIGRDGQSVLKVITNKGTNEIISMYPTRENSKNNVFLNDNLFELYIHSHDCKIKKLTQTDKFKLRFSKTKALNK